MGDTLTAPPPASGAAPAPPSGGLTPDQFFRGAGAGATTAPAPPPPPEGLTPGQFFRGGASSSASDGNPGAAPGTFGQNLAAGAVEGLTGLANTASDPFGNIVGKPVELAATYLHDAIGPYFGIPKFTPQERAEELGDAVPQPGTRLTAAIAKAEGARLPSDVAPADGTSAAARAGVAGLIAGAPLGPVGALAGAGGAVAGNVAAQSAGPYWGPLADFAGQLAGAGLAAGTVAGGKALIDAGRPGDLLRPIIGRPAPVIDPATGTPVAVSTVTGNATDATPIQATPGVQLIAARKLAAAATDPAAARAALAPPVANTPPPPAGVPGFEPTTFQATGDAGLGNFERVAAKNSPELAITRANQQNASGVRAVQGLAGSGDADAPGAAVRAQLDAMTARDQASVDAARQSATAALDAAGGATPPGGEATALQSLGSRMRGAPETEGGAPSSLVAANAAAKARENALWTAIDPDGTLAADMSPVRDAARDMLNTMPRNAAPLADPEAGIFETARTLPTVQPFAELTAFRTRLTDAMRDELQARGRSAAYGRMSQLLGAVHDAMEGTVDAQAAGDRQAVAAGQMRPGESIAARLNQDFNDYDTRASSSRNSGSALEQISSGTSDGSASLRGGEGPGAQRPGSAGSNSNLAPAAAAQVKPRSLLQFLISRGGIRDEGGELAALGLNNRTRPTLIRAGGMPLDRAREAAIEAGYLPPDNPNAPNRSDIPMLLDAIGEEAAGRKVYRPGEGAAVAIDAATARGLRRQEEAMARARAAVGVVADDMGVQLGAEGHAHAAELVAGHDLHPQAAVESVLRAQDAATQNARTRLDAMGPQTGMPLAARQAELTAEPPLKANFDAAAADRYKAARDATAQRHATFTNAPGVGRALAPGSRASDFKLPESHVPGEIFRPGAGGAERVQAYLKAGGDPAAVQDYAALSLRKAAQNADGTLDPGKYASWMRSHAEAMTALERQEPGLAANFKNAATASEAVRAAAVQAADRNKSFQASAAGKFLGDADPVAVLGKMLNSDRSTALISDLMHQLGGNTAARDGLRQAAVQYILRNKVGNAAAGDTGTEMIRSDQFQTFTKKAAPALRMLLGADDFKTLEEVARNLQTVNRSIAGTKLPGGSNTPQDLAAGLKHGAARSTVLGQIIFAEGLEGIGSALGHSAGGHTLTGAAAGLAAGVGALFLKTMRDAGVQRAQQLAEMAAFSPSLARALLAKAHTAEQARAAERGLRVQLNKALMAAAAAPPTPQPARPRPGLATPAGAPRVSAGAGLGL